MKSDARDGDGGISDGRVSNGRVSDGRLSDERGRNDPAEPDEDLSDVWKALSNPVRRRMLDLLRQGPRTTGELDEQFPEHSRFAVMQHLRVLEAADLIVPRREGRKRFNYLNAVPIQQIYTRWVSGYMQPWTEALVGLKHDLEGRARRA